MADNDFRVQTTELFNKMKRINASDEYVCIPILDSKKHIVGLLKPITYDYKELYSDIVPIMSRWRRDNPSLSNSVFKVTEERTTRWLDELILKRGDRLLFFIDELDGRHVGHIAYSSFDFDNKTAEIDAVLRGENSKVKGIMTFTIKAMLDWAERNLALQNIQLRVNEDNEKAISLYERCGFKIIKKIPLFRREMADEIRWDEDPERNESEAERFEYVDLVF